MPYVSTDFNATDLPDATPLQDKILSWGDLAFWGQADRNSVTIASGEIEEYRDLGGSGAKFVPGGDYAKANYVGAFLNGLGVARHYGYTTPDDGGIDRYRLTGAVLPENSPYTYWAVFRTLELLNGNAILGRYTAVGTRALMHVPTTGAGVSILHGSSGITVDPGRLDDWIYAVCSFDGTKIRISANGVRSPAVDAVGGTGTADIFLGARDDTGSQGVDGHIAEFGILRGDVFTNGRIEFLEEYLSTTYGL